MPLGDTCGYFMTYITQKMDLVMIDFQIEYPGAEKYTGSNTYSLINPHTKNKEKK